MDKKEFSMFTMALKTYYPRENLLPNTQAMELWFRQLQDIPYNIAEVALNQWVATNKWSPSIAEIRETVATVKNGEVPDWGAGWEQVLWAIRRYGMYNIQKAMESFDPITKQCVERMGFKNICISENINQERANFRMIYEQVSDRVKKQEQIPLQLTQTISQIQNQFALEDKSKSNNTKHQRDYDMDALDAMEMPRQYDFVELERKLIEQNRADDPERKAGGS